MYDARQIANWFIERAAKDGRALSITSLLKLPYIAHGWYLESRNKPLFHNRIEAWKFGPVIPAIYYGFKGKGKKYDKPLPNYPSPTDESDARLLERIYEGYGNLSPTRLSDITHEPGGPWHIASRLGGYYAPIPNKLILGHYVEKRRKWEAKNGKQ